jgi:DNA-binding SARP family transcriptional activator
MSVKPKPPKKSAAKAMAAAPAEQTQQDLRETCEAAWRVWDAAAINAACEALEPAPPFLLGEVRMWQAMASFMCEGADALAYLDEAWEASIRTLDAAIANASVCRALAFLVLDLSAMSNAREWLARWDKIAVSFVSAKGTEIWHQLAPLAALALGGNDHAGAEAAAAALERNLSQPRHQLSPDERLIVAHMLVEHRFATQRFSAFDLLANAVEAPKVFDAASPLIRARWLLTYGYATHHTARADEADKSWKRALEIASLAGLPAVALQVTLAMARGMLNAGQVDQAEKIIAGVQPHWGAGRNAQLVELLRLRARVHLLRGRNSSALNFLEDALRTADVAAMPRSECAPCLSDLVQVYVALGRIEDAETLLGQQEREQQGRDADVSRCQTALLKALRLRYEEPEQSRISLHEGLAIAQRVRYTMFFRLLPVVAASICDMALRLNIAVAFVLEVIRARALPAPTEAGSDWPWHLWIQILGNFEMTLGGIRQMQSGKVAQKPLELLRLLACQRRLSISMSVAMDALWQDAEAGAARKNLDITIHRARSLIGDPTLLWVGDGQLGLEVGRVASDLKVRREYVDRLESMAIKCQAGQSTDQAVTTECLELVDCLAQLTSADLLPGMPLTSWVQAEQRQCRSDTVRAALAAAAILGQTQSSRAEQELLETALRIEPSAESLVERQMLAYSEVGRRGDSLRVYEAYRRNLEPLGIQPNKRLLSLWKSLVGVAVN